MLKLMSIFLALALALGITPVKTLTETPTKTEYVDVIYAQEHPDEIMALDIDQLLVGWGYQGSGEKTAREQYMEWYEGTGYTLEQVVRTQYIYNRLDVQHCLELLPGWQEEFPELWASFDADAWFADHIQQQGEEDERRSKEAYMAYNNILTEEEFVACIFDACVHLHIVLTWE